MIPPWLLCSPLLLIHNQQVAAVLGTLGLNLKFQVAPISIRRLCCSFHSFSKSTLGLNLKFYIQVAPIYASSVVFELLQDDADMSKYSVRIFYNQVILVPLLTGCCCPLLCVCLLPLPCPALPLLVCPLPPLNSL